MAGIRTSRQKGAVLVTASALLLLLTLLVLGDVEEVRRQLRLAAAEQQQQEFLQLVRERLAEAEQAAAGTVHTFCLPEEIAGIGCTEALYVPGEHISPQAEEDCRPQTSLPLPWQEPAFWPAPPAPGAPPVLRSIAEFRCFLPSSPAQSLQPVPLYRVTVLAVSDTARLGLQSLWSPRGRHGLRYLQP